MARDISAFIRDNLAYFQGYEKVILYYDNGQHELNRILNTVLATQLTDYDVRKVLPSDYRLFQVADLICTLELLKIKAESGQLSKSEERMFHSKRELKKDFLKGIGKKEFYFASTVLVRVTAMIVFWRERSLATREVSGYKNTAHIYTNVNGT